MAFNEPVESEEYFPEKLKVAFSFITGVSMLPVLMDPSTPSAWRGACWGVPGY